MQRALELAALGQGRTAPNPMVGAVVVRDGEVLAEGYHRARGLPHAELDALHKLGPEGAARGATLYVTLEPCCHHGRTPPCTEAVLASGISRVVVGMVDPDDRMRGKGIELLRSAGLVVDVGVEETACRHLNAVYVVAREEGRPFITLKAAITLDGRIASAEGESQWITGEPARTAGHQLRADHDAVMVGSGTLHMDDPSLTTRLVDGPDALPVVLDTRLGCPEGAKILSAGRRPVLICVEGTPGRDLPADILPVPAGPGGVDLPQALQALLRRGVHSILVEGGGQVHRSLLEADLVDRIELFLAPKVLAGGPGWVGGAPFALAEAPGFRVLGSRQLGDDLQVTLERDARQPKKG
jgi:diaminohydroxyphosphoribosylaminopyrimidine deaminase/5-amino-6-(5-phosphoribosylamino)uracil reductase